MKDIDRITVTVERIKGELERLKDVDVPLIEDKEEYVFKTDFPFDNAIVNNFEGVHKEYKQKADHLFRFFENEPNQYISKDDIHVNVGTYWTHPLYVTREPKKWFKAMFPYMCQQLIDTPEIINAAFVIADADSGVAPHYGPKAEDKSWPCLRGQSILQSDNESLLCQLKGDEIYLRNQVEGDNFYFDDTELHWIRNYSKNKRVVLLYDFLVEDKSTTNIDIYNLALHQ